MEASDSMLFSISDLFPVSDIREERRSLSLTYASAFSFSADMKGSGAEPNLSFQPSVLIIVPAWDSSLSSFFRHESDTAVRRFTSASIPDTTSEAFFISSSAEDSLSCILSASS